MATRMAYSARIDPSQSGHETNLPFYNEEYKVETGSSDERAQTF